MKVRITKEFSFEASHFLPGYDGLCANIHGHSYRLFVTLIGEPRNSPGHPKDGMLIDFGVLKRIVHEQIVGVLDHSLMVREGSYPELQALLVGQMRLVQFPFQPTCENMLGWMATRLRNVLPQEVSLFAIRIYETATSYAEWYAADELL